ncbi:MAG: hypothetical protein CMI02_04985 [Oceanospirillaceae bacterium]|nr:hypothetical protein [Oceanospirillaceae bacterium]
MAFSESVIEDLLFIDWLWPPLQAEKILPHVERALAVGVVAGCLLRGVMRVREQWRAAAAFATKRCGQPPLAAVSERVGLVKPDLGAVGDQRVFVEMQETPAQAGLAVDEQGPGLRIRRGNAVEVIGTDAVEAARANGSQAVSPTLKDAHAGYALLHVPAGQADGQAVPWMVVDFLITISANKSMQVSGEPEPLEQEVPFQVGAAVPGDDPAGQAAAESVQQLSDQVLHAVFLFLGRAIWSAARLASIPRWVMVHLWSAPFSPYAIRPACSQALMALHTRASLQLLFGSLSGWV